MPRILKAEGDSFLGHDEGKGSGRNRETALSLHINLRNRIVLLESLSQALYIYPPRDNRAVADAQVVTCRLQVLVSKRLQLDVPGAESLANLGVSQQAHPIQSRGRYNDTNQQVTARLGRCYTLVGCLSGHASAHATPTS
jgi:hypothetical protein